MSFGAPPAGSWRRRLARALCVPVAVLLGMLALAVCVANLSYGYAVTTIDEYGPIEGATVAVYAAVLGDCIYLALSGIARAAWTGAVFVALPLLRELDFHKAYTLMSVTSTRYWRSGVPPWTEKAVAAAVFAALLVLALLALRITWKPFWHRLRGLQPDAVTLAAAPVLALAASALDKLVFIDIIVPPEAVIFRAIEESLELGAAVCTLLALVLWRRASRVRER